MRYVQYTYALELADDLPALRSLMEHVVPRTHRIVGDPVATVMRGVEIDGEMTQMPDCLRVEVEVEPR